MTPLWETPPLLIIVSFIGTLAWVLIALFVDPYDTHHRRPR